MRILFVCNTVYQVLVASWIKYKYYRNEECDIIVSDHMNRSEHLCQNIAQTDLFQQVYSVKAKDYVYKHQRPYNNRAEKYYYSIFPDKALAHYCKLGNTYDVLFISNYNTFNALVFDVLKRRNRDLKLNIFEDGLATYSKVTAKYYRRYTYPDNKLIRFVYKRIFRRNLFAGNVSTMSVFEKDLCEWCPDCRIEEIEKIDITDTAFKKLVNQIFDYAGIADKYDKAYIYFEESYYADTGYMEDVSLIEQLAALVGKENIMIKIHPRNPVNRFKELGYQTNVNTSVPWEVIAMNTDLSDTKLVSIASTSILNPILVLNLDVKSYSLINILTIKPELLNGPLSNTLISSYKRFPDNITICSDLSDVLK